MDTLLKVPSGCVFGPEDLRLARDFARVGFIKWSKRPFTLRSGIESHVYVYGREDLTENPDVLAQAGRKILTAVRNWMFQKGDSRRRPRFIGLPTAGTALASAAALADVRPTPFPPAFCIMREVEKREHGAHQGFVNGAYQPKVFRDFVLDNVATDGGTKIDAVPKFLSDGFPAYDLDWIIFVDRQQGALGRLAKAGFKSVLVVYNLLDLTFAYEKLGLWPAHAVQMVEKEIADHQFAS